LTTRDCQTTGLPKVNSPPFSELRQGASLSFKTTKKHLESRALILLHSTNDITVNGIIFNPGSLLKLLPALLITPDATSTICFCANISYPRKGHLTRPDVFSSPLFEKYLRGSVLIFFGSRAPCRHGISFSFFHPSWFSSLLFSGRASSFHTPPPPRVFFCSPPKPFQAAFFFQRD